MDSNFELADTSLNASLTWKQLGVITGYNSLSLANINWNDLMVIVTRQANTLTDRALSTTFMFNRSGFSIVNANINIGLEQGINYGSEGVAYRVIISNNSVSIADVQINGSLVSASDVKSIVLYK